LIDRYIKKSDDDALDRLENEIVALQREYFAARSDPLREVLALHNYGFVGDPVFDSLLRELIDRHGIAEYYLYPTPAGILMYNRDGKAMLMVVETEESMESHYEMACDNEAPDSLLNALRERRIIPYFRDGDGMYSRDLGNGWHRYIEPAQVCQGREKYYWALFKLAPGELEQPAVSFNDFLRSHQPAG
jgi:hypothetical protein